MASDWIYRDPTICGYDPAIHDKQEWPHPGKFPFSKPQTRRKEMFHLIEGLFFERLADGSVRILKTNGKLETDPVTFDMIIDAHQWDGVVAALDHGMAAQVAVQQPDEE